MCVCVCDLWSNFFCSLGLVEEYSLESLLECVLVTFWMTARVQGVCLCVCVRSKGLADKMMLRSRQNDAENT